MPDNIRRFRNCVTIIQGQGIIHKLQKFYFTFDKNQIIQYLIQKLL